MFKVVARINKPKTSHLFSIETKVDGATVEVHVEANTRTQAANIAKKAGYPVRSVNMIG